MLQLVALQPEQTPAVPATGALAPEVSFEKQAKVEGRRAAGLWQVGQEAGSPDRVSGRSMSNRCAQAWQAYS